MTSQSLPLDSSPNFFKICWMHATRCPRRLHTVGHAPHTKQYNSIFYGHVVLNKANQISFDWSFCPSDYLFLLYILFKWIISNSLKVEHKHTHTHTHTHAHFVHTHIHTYIHTNTYTHTNTHIVTQGQKQFQETRCMPG